MPLDYQLSQQIHSLSHAPWEPAGQPIILRAQLPPRDTASRVRAADDSRRRSAANVLHLERARNKLPLEGSPNRLYERAMEQNQRIADMRMAAYRHKLKEEVEECTWMPCAPARQA